jgi:hypothetical protein
MSQSLEKIASSLSVTKLSLHSIHPHTIVFRMGVQPTQQLVTVQLCSAFHLSSSPCVQNGNGCAANPAACYCSALFCIPSSLIPLCSEWVCSQSSRLSLFRFVLHSIQPHAILFRMVLQPVQPLVTVQNDCAVHPAS